jgi:UDP-N-acetylmuramyl pentapeptide synthase
MFELRDALGWLSAGRLIGDPSVAIREVCTDTRSLAAGALFVALRGERHDAHAFLAGARNAGAAAVMFERWVENIPLPALWVPDTRRALGELALGWRRRYAQPLIAVTGSNGKTTVKEMISAILAQAFGEDARLATRGNLNNEIGVPLTLFRLRESQRAAVLELGMNQPGEIAWLAKIAAPTVALVNNAQREHQEFLSGVEATAIENGQAIAALPADGVAVYPGDDPCSPIWRELAAGRRQIEFGLLGPGASEASGPAGASGDPAFAPASAWSVWAPVDAKPQGFTMTIDGEPLVVRLAIDGAHNVRNALAAAACAHAIGIDSGAIARGLSHFRPVAGRLRRLQAASGAALVDDSYNANPDSVRAAIDVLSGLAGPRVLVLGDMGEVGADGPRYHREVGDYARERGIEHLLAAGDATQDTVAAFGAGAEHFADIESLSARAAVLARPPATVLVKGSRFMRMERVVDALAGSSESEAH